MSHNDFIPILSSNASQNGNYRRQLEFVCPPSRDGAYPAMSRENAAEPPTPIDNGDPPTRADVAPQDPVTSYLVLQGEPLPRTETDNNYSGPPVVDEDTQLNPDRRNTPTDEESVLLDVERVTPVIQTASARIKKPNRPSPMENPEMYRKYNPLARKADKCHPGKLMPRVDPEVMNKEMSTELLTPSTPDVCNMSKGGEGKNSGDDQDRKSGDQESHVDGVGSVDLSQVYNKKTVSQQYIPFDNRVSYEASRSAVCKYFGATYRVNPPMCERVRTNTGPRNCQRDQDDVDMNERKDLSTTAHRQQKNRNDPSPDPTASTDHQQRTKGIQTGPTSPPNGIRSDLSAANTTNSTRTAAARRNKTSPYMSNREAKCLDGLIITAIPGNKDDSLSPGAWTGLELRGSDAQPGRPSSSRTYASSQCNTRTAEETDEGSSPPFIRLGDARIAYKVVHQRDLPAGSVAMVQNMRVLPNAAVGLHRIAQRYLSQQAEVVQTSRSSGNQNNTAASSQNEEEPERPQQQGPGVSRGDKTPGEDQVGTRNAGRGNRRFRVLDSALDSGEGDGSIVTVPRLSSFLNTVTGENAKPTHIQSDQSDHSGGIEPT